MSIIADWLSKAFGKTEYRVLTWGFYGGGSTTGLYKLKLGETVSTIPTIGFNVETVPVKGGISLTMWDLGGRDRIRPLWRHYFQNTQGLIFYVDSGIRDPEHHQFMRDELDRFLCEDELRGVPVLICANKQDGPKPMTGAEVAEVLRLNAIRGRPWYVQETCALTGEGLQEGIAWLAQALKGEKSTPTLSERARQAGSEWLAGVFQQGKAMTTPSGTAAEKAKSSDDSQDQPQQQPAKETSGAPSAASKQKQKSAGEARQEALLTGLLQAKDEVSDDDFLAGIEHKTLDPWDHLTLLRLIWLLLSRHGRRGGKDQLFKGLEDLRRDAEAFHVTIAYFWMHMVHYAMTATLNPTGDLKGLLVLNPQLCDAQLVQMYYSEGLLSVSPEAKSEVVLPDKKPLPSVITKMDVKKGPQEKEGQQGSSAPNVSEQDDEDYLDQLHDRTLRSWGHEAKLRAIWLLLRKHGRRQGGTSKVLQALQDFEGAAHNVTESYFWVQMVTLRAAEAPACAGYAAFIARPSCKPLIQPNLILNYYSSEALDQGAAEFRLPDKQQLPSTVKKQ